MKQWLKDSEKFKYMIYNKIKHCHNYIQVFTEYKLAQDKQKLSQLSYACLLTFNGSLEIIHYACGKQWISILFQIGLNDLFYAASIFI